MVVAFKSIKSQLNQSLNEKKERSSFKIMDKLDSAASKGVRSDRNKQDLELSPKEYFDEKSNNELLRIPSNSNNWWPNDAEEKLEPRQRWSYGSDISIEAVESIQNRLCCSPVDEFDSTVSSETEDLIVNNTEEGSETYDACIQISPACSPTFKNVIHSNGQKQRKSHELYTADDELVDYSKRYTTDSSGSMVETKPIGSHIQERQQRGMVLNNVSRPVPQKKSVNTRSKGYPFGDYAETDLDQPTDYSLRYAEEDTDEEEKEDTRFYCSEQPEEDIVKTYYTEGTPSNFSTATSMTDLSTFGDFREGDEAAYKSQFLRGQKQEIIEKSEKSPKDCRSRIKQKFASEDSKIPILKATQQHCDQPTCDRKMEKLCTPPQSPAEISSKENKAVTFQVEENNYAQETPLMFSRSSSLDSLSEFDQASIQDDRSSIISDFSHRTSGAVSPSELPDSPTQTVPPSPRRLERDSFSNLPRQQEQESVPPRGIERENVQSLHQQQAVPELQPQPQVPPLPQSQIQGVPIRSASRNPATVQPPLPQQSHSGPSMQRTTPNGQVPLAQHPQTNNRTAPMQRPHPEGRAAPIQRAQPDSRAPTVQGSQVDNRGPVIQRPQVDRLMTNANPAVHTMASPREAQLPRHIPDRCISVFEDNLVRFKTESMQGKFSTAASSLSALTIDDEDDNVSVDNREIVNRIMAIRVRSSAAGMHQAPCTQKQCGVTSGPEKQASRQPRVSVSNGRSGYRSNGSHAPVSKEDSHYINVEDESHDYTTSYSNKEAQNSRYRDSPREQWYENEPKNDNRKAPRSPVCSRNNNDVVVRHLEKPELPDIIVVDTLQTYCTENTPVFVSPYGSQANLSGLSSLSMSDDDEDDFGYGLIENGRASRSPHLDEAERSNSRVDSYDESGDSSGASDDEDEDEDKSYAGDSSLAARRRIDVSPFDSQVNLNFSLLRIEEEDEEEEAADASNETDRSPNTESPVDDDEDDYRQLSRRNSECSDDEVLEQCIKSGVSKVTRHSVDSSEALK